MTIKLSDELKQALANQPSGQPLRVEDEDTNTQYVIVQMEVFERMQRAISYDDSDLTSEEMRAAAQLMLEDPEGWGAPGMEIYDTYKPPQYDPPRKTS